MNRLYYCILFLLMACSSPKTEQPSVDWEQERMARVKIDFSRTEDEVKTYIQKYIPDVTDEQMRHWEETKALEYMIFDGEKRYFRNAAPNLFRVDSVARTIKIAKDGNPLSGSEKVNQQHLPEVIKAVKSQQVDTVLPTRMKVKYTLTVDANAVPDGEMIRCWLPYPKDNQYRQKDVKFISASEPEYIFSPESYQHSTLYMEKKAVKDQPTIFSEEFEYTSYAEWGRLKPENILPYDTTTDMYKEYTAERESHILFSPRIKALAEQLAGDEPNPLLKAQRYFKWINDNFPWASAREYSTIPNIPEYVLDNHHGDCGQVTLLFITLCRYSGIPAHFQSGFMMHPGAWNLHDWAEIYFEGIGWVPVDQSFGIPVYAQTPEEEMFFLGGIDAWRMIVNNDYSMPLYPEKKYPRSETVDFQRGEVEWREGNLYFNQWNYDMQIVYL
ncbi:transglutaminase family protein [Bacteroides sp. 51]|uniref:transglutaminase-like domain-containing protein n=1 Tax=Bacteroides sp. 51 TaxID=2302938 RepID=UPI0013D2062F|nr:transglutaminase domain-containing protein [Bacteroides sp. 51]NDV84907.1 transglutaminase domain-containing protein [Bacteroides sp. 51]